MCRSGNDNGGCNSAIFTTYTITFNKICGQVKGYQKGSTDAFHSTKYITKSINDYYVDGLSITLGNPHKHVWTYATETSDDGDYPHHNCPCAATHSFTQMNVAIATTPIAILNFISNCFTPKVTGP